MANLFPISLSDISRSSPLPLSRRVVAPSVREIVERNLRRLIDVCDGRGIARANRRRNKKVAQPRGGVPHSVV